MIYRVKALIPYWDNEGSKPAEHSPYRVIELSSETILANFAEIVMKSFDFDFFHPYGFYNNVNSYLSAKQGFVMKFEDDESLTFDHNNIYGDVNKSNISEIFTRRGKRWLLLYDYGEEWSVWVSLIDRIEAEENIIYPRITEKHMESPLQYE